MKIILTYILILFAASSASAQTPKRVITIGGALTEIVYALKAENLLVGNDTSSYFPPAANRLPKVGYQRTLSAEGILSLNPDLVILTGEAGPPAVVKQIESANVLILRLEVARSLEGVKASIATIAKALKKEKAAKTLIRKINIQSRQLRRLVQKNTNRKRVMFILQHGGGAPMIAGTGTAADSIIKLSGARNVVVDYQGHKPLTPEAAVSLKPDVILIDERGLKMAGGKEALLQIPGISLTPAAKKGNVIAMDSLLMLGFGPRTAKAAKELNEAYQGL